MSQHQLIRLRLAISPERFLAYYRGSVKTVLARALDGRTVSFPAQVLQPYVTHDGVSGEFDLEIDHNNRFVRLSRVSG